MNYFTKCGVDDSELRYFEVTESPFGFCLVTCNICL